MPMADALIDRLAADLPPVRPRRASREFGVLLGVAAIEAVLILVLGLARPDLGPVMPPMFWWKLAAPAALGVLATATALRALDPARRTVGVRWLGLLALAALGVGWALAGVEPMGDLDPDLGLRCVVAATIFSVPPALALGVLLRHGAPSHPSRVAVAAAIAGGAWGAAFLGLHCPNDGVMHALLWHSFGIALPALAAALPLTRAARW